MRRLIENIPAIRRSRELAGHDRWTSAELKSNQQQRLEAIVQHARTKSAFYRRLYRDVDEIALDRLPVVDKATVMDHFDELVCDPRLTLPALEAHLDGLQRDDLYLGEYRVLATGGTTGRKGVFAYDRLEWRELVAGFYRMSDFVGLRPRLPRRVRVAAVGAARPAHMTYRLSASADTGLFKILRLSATSPIADIVAALNTHRPEFLYAYSSVVSLLTLEQLEGRLDIAPRIVVTSGETPTRDLAAAVRSAWGGAWFELYGTTETGILGVHCAEHAGLHLFEDQFIVEVVDENHRPVQPGQTADHLLLTSLINRTQPLIRYVISDLVTIRPEPCSCGRPYRLVAGIEGRSDDILRLSGSGGAEIVVHPLVLRSPMAAVPGLREYRILHDERGLHVRVALRPGVGAGDTTAAIRQGLSDAVTALGAAKPEVSIEVVERIEGGRDAVGKFRLIESRVQSRHDRPQAASLGP
jgi:phenylacetate-CoA ligase